MRAGEQEDAIRCGLADGRVLGQLAPRVGVREAQHRTQVAMPRLEYTAGDCAEALGALRHRDRATDASNSAKRAIGGLNDVRWSGSDTLLQLLVRRAPSAVIREVCNLLPKQQVVGVANRWGDRWPVEGSETADESGEP